MEIHKLVMQMNSRKKDSVLETGGNGLVIGTRVAGSVIK